MISIFKYETEEEASQIIADQTGRGMILVQVSNVTEGNFLGFSDGPLPPAKTPIEQEVDAVKTRLAISEQSAAENSLTTQELIETLFDLGVI